MVAQNVDLPAIVPVPPEWMREQRRRGSNVNRNINPIFWKKPDGWIVVGPSAIPGPDGRPITRQAESLIRRGWTPLIEYSYTDKTDETGERLTIDNGKDSGDRLHTPDRYYWLFRNGGAHLFTIEQIVAHKWHITPPFGLDKSVFPQLLEYDVPPPYWCPACPGTSPNRNSIEEVATHLMVNHRMTLPQVRDLQEHTNNFLDQPVGASGLAIRRKAQAAEARGEAMAAQEVTQPKTQRCNQCGAPITGKLAEHTCS